MTTMSATTLPARCRPIQMKIDGLIAQRSSLQRMLQQASTPQKPELASEIKGLSRKIAGQRSALTRCKNAG